MKKILLIFTCIILTACSTNKSLLNKKQECFKYKKELEKRHNKQLSIKGLQTYSYVNNVFYSKKQDSCLYMLTVSSIHSGKPGENGQLKVLGLYDYLEGEKLYSIQGCDGELHCGSSVTEAENTFQKQLKKYE